MIVEGRITDESIKSKLTVDEYGLFREKRTNADRIRAMTDEELADWLCHIVSNETVNCFHCIVEEYCKMGRNGFIKWLKQEVET